MDDRERVNVLVDDLSAIITDAIAEVLGDKWEGCSFNATDARNRAAAEFAKVRQEGMREMQVMALDAEPDNPSLPPGISALSYSIGFAKGIDVMRSAIRALAPLPVKDGGA